jgi:hypothetical protein
MESAQTFTASCLPIDDDWVASWWDGPLALADRLRPRGAETARAALRSIFPPSLVPWLRAERHPIVSHQFTIAGRLGLLELGLAIACVPADQEDVQRLRNPAEYEGVAAELRSALMFLRAGARLERPPQTRDERCEYIATFPSGERLAIEVKYPSQSERELDGARVSSELLMALMDRLHWLPLVVPAAWATFHFAPTILDLGDRAGTDPDRLRDAVDGAVKLVAAALRGGSPYGTVDLGRLGSFEVREDPRVLGVQFAAAGPELEPRKVGGRLRRNLLNKAARQVGETKLSGIVVLDIQRDALARNALRFLAGWARQRESLAALVVIDRSSVAGQGGLHGAVDILPGPMFDTGRNALARAFEICGSGHLHYSPLSSFSDPCPFTWLARVQ